MKIEERRGGTNITNFWRRYIDLYVDFVMTGYSLRAQSIHVEIEIPYKKNLNIQP